GPAKEPADDYNDKADTDQINRADVRARDWKKHELSPAAAQEPKQKRGHSIQGNGLAGDEQECNSGIDVAMLRFEVIQPLAQEMKDQKEIANDQDGIDRQLKDRKSV